MPADIRAYGEKNLKFPHQSTANQWFGESQFESYRKLGFFQGEILTALAVQEGDLNQFFNNACLNTKTKVSSPPAVGLYPAHGGTLPGIRNVSKTTENPRGYSTTRAEQHRRQNRRSQFRTGA